SLPLIDGSLQLVRDGVMSGGCTRGRDHYGGRVHIDAGVDAALAMMLFDAETSGGLLLAVAAADAELAVRGLRDAGAPGHAAIGTFVARRDGEPVLTLR